MEVIKVEDIAMQRKLEAISGALAAQSGLIDYIACMADVDMPESGSTDEEDVGHDA